MMKKVICLLLVFVCSLSLFACGSETADNKEPAGNNPPAVEPEKPGAEKEPIDNKTEVSDGDKAFFLIIDKSKPNVITTRTVTEDRTYKISLEGMFETRVLGDDSYVYTYQYEKVNSVLPDDIAEGGMKEMVPGNEPGVIYYSQGKYSRDNSNWTTEYPDVEMVNVKLDLAAGNLGSYKISADGTTLTTSVSASDAEKIFGIDIDDVIGSVSVTIVNNGTYLWKVNVSYSTLTAKVTLETTYTYEPIAASVQ
jgi:hypothetical protein